MTERTAGRLAWTICGVAVAAMIADQILFFVTPQAELAAAVPAERRRRRRRAREPRAPADRRGDRLPPTEEPARMAPHRCRSRASPSRTSATPTPSTRRRSRARSSPARPSSTGSRPGRWSLAFASLPLLLLLFPTGKLHSRRWRPVLWASLVCGSAAGRRRVRGGDRRRVDLERAAGGRRHRRSRIRGSNASST